MAMRILVGCKRVIDYAVKVSLLTKFEIIICLFARSDKSQAGQNWSCDTRSQAFVESI